MLPPFRSVALMLLFACSGSTHEAPPTSAQSEHPPQASVREVSEVTRVKPSGRKAILEVAPPRDKGRQGKQFNGILLKTATEELVASYSREEAYAMFDGREVFFDGEPFVPKGQALINSHVHLGRVMLASPTNEDLYLTVSSPQSVCGDLLTKTVAPGQKAAGETFRVFVIQDSEHEVQSSGLPEDGRYQVSLRHMQLNADYDPVSASAMSLPSNPVWISRHNIESCVQP